MAVTNTIALVIAVTKNPACTLSIAGASRRLFWRGREKVATTNVFHSSPCRKRVPLRLPTQQATSFDRQKTPVCGLYITTRIRDSRLEQLASADHPGVFAYAFPCPSLARRSRRLSSAGWFRPSAWKSLARTG